MLKGPDDEEGGWVVEDDGSEKREGGSVHRNLGLKERDVFE